jgi:hypothetical protein
MELSISESAKNQSEVYEIEIGGAWLVDLNKFYIDAYYATNHTAYDYNIEFDFKNTDIKKIFYSAFLFKLCDFLKNNKRKNIFYFDERCEIQHFKYIVTRCRAFLPIHVYTNRAAFEEIMWLKEIGDAEICSELEKVISRSMQFNFFNFSFRRLNNFLKKNDLNYLKNAYFNQHQIKLALLT